MRATVLLMLLMIALCASGFAHATEIHRCTSSRGAVSFQDKPCAASARQSIVHVTDAPVTATVSPTEKISAPTPAATVATPAVMPVSASLPMMYACTRYDGQRHYLSDTLPRPYAVPLGAMGYPGQSLDRAYAPPNGLGMSAPEEARPPRVGGPLIAGAYVEVQDYCHPASRDQVCGELRKRFDANHEQLRMAFPSDQPPLQQREDQLNAQMKGC